MAPELNTISRIIRNFPNFQFEKNIYFKVLSSPIFSNGFKDSQYIQVDSQLVQSVKPKIIFCNFKSAFTQKSNFAISIPLIPQSLLLKFNALSIIWISS